MSIVQSLMISATSRFAVNCKILRRAQERQLNTVPKCRSSLKVNSPGISALQLTTIHSITQLIMLPALECAMTLSLVRELGVTCMTPKTDPLAANIISFEQVSSAIPYIYSACSAS